MNHRRTVVSALLLALPALAFAGPTAELSSFNAGSAFKTLQFTGAVKFVPAQFVQGTSLGAGSFTDSAPLDKLHLHTVVEGGFAATAAGQPVSTVDLPTLLNRNLKAGLSANLGGKNVSLSGVFDRGTFDKAKNAYVDPNAFVSLLIEGESAVRIYNVKDLLTNPQTLAIGSGQFKLKLSPDLSDQLESEIVVINLANNHKDRITLRALLTEVGNAGEAFTLGGQVYKLFYYDEIKGGKMDPTGKLYAFIATDPKGELHVFMIPGELVSDKTTTFKMLGDKPMGLKRAGDKLQIFANP